MDELLSKVNIYCGDQQVHYTLHEGTLTVWIGKESPTDSIPHEKIEDKHVWEHGALVGEFVHWPDEDEDSEDDWRKLDYLDDLEEYNRNESFDYEDEE